MVRNLNRRVVCTGLGIVSPLGIGVRSSWSSLLAGKSGITKLKDEHSFEGCQSKVAAYVPSEEFLETCRKDEHQYLVKNSKQLSRATTFAMVASHEALQDAKLLDESSNQLLSKFRSRCGVAIGQGMVDFQDIYDNGNLLINPATKSTGFRKISPYFMTRALINMSSGNVSIRYKLNGPSHCVSTACATGAHSIGDALNFIRNGQADLMVCGSTEASINSIAMAGFERLKALCTKFNDNPSASSRPFDMDRCGFVMGEGSGILVLEDLQHARSRGLRDEDIYCEILGYGTSSDAYHLTAPSPDGFGARESMRSALLDAGLEPTVISHVNAHATSTPLGDDIECNAIEEFYKGNTELTVTSTKGSIGHLLGAAGSVESIFAILSCRYGLIPKTLNLDKPLDTSLEFVRGDTYKWSNKSRILMKNSFGFGGTNASICISNIS